MPTRSLITEADVISAWKAGSRTLVHAPDAIVTPLARDTARTKGIELRPADPLAEGGASWSPRVVVVGSDHRGHDLKQHLLAMLRSEGYACVDVGCHGTGTTHYPLYAYAVAVLVAGRRADAGIMIDGAGIGSAIAANKVRGVRAAACHDQATARAAREHNDATMLTLAGTLPPVLAHDIVRTFLTTGYDSRHAVRLDLLSQIEARTMKDVR